MHMFRLLHLQSKDNAHYVKTVLHQASLACKHCLNAHLQQPEVLSSCMSAAVNKQAEITAHLSCHNFISLTVAWLAESNMSDAVPEHVCSSAHTAVRGFLHVT